MRLLDGHTGLARPPHEIVVNSQNRRRFHDPESKSLVEIDVLQPINFEITGCRGLIEFFAVALHESAADAATLGFRGNPDRTEMDMRFGRVVFGPGSHP